MPRVYYFKLLTNSGRYEGPLERPGVLVASAGRFWSGFSLHVPKLTLGSRLSRLATPRTPLDFLNSTSPNLDFRTFRFSTFWTAIRDEGLRHPPLEQFGPLYDRTKLVHFPHSPKQPR